MIFLRKENSHLEFPSFTVIALVVRGVGAGNGVTFTVNERRQWSVTGSS